MSPPNPHNAVVHIRRALLVEGPRPDIHRAQIRKLSREWPTLYRALMATLTDEERIKLGQS